MTSTRSWIAATLTAASMAFFGWAAPASAQNPKPPNDEGLEKLLEKLDEKPGPDKSKDEKKDAGPDKPKDEGLDKLLEKLDEKPGAAKDEKKGTGPDKPKTSGEVAPKDQDLDKLLEGLGQPKDTPAPEDKKPGGPGPGDPMPPKSGEPKPDELKGDDQELDKDLERITGKKEAPKNKRDRKGEEEGGPLGQVIKEMRDVEERLGKPDTGEETRKKQTEIVKNLEQLIEQMKNAPSQAQGLKMIRQGNKPGQQPGQQPGDQPGAQANGTPPSKPEKPKNPPIPTELAKSIWGQLPAQFRDEMGNVLNEHPLPTKADLIRLYYLSLGNKNSSREE